jgi:hypothetical protein
MQNVRILAVILALTAPALAQADAAPAKHRVLVELFTSQG